MGPTKVFVGNLSFKTKEAELADEFSTAGKVITANIITRGYRSLGYGFVEFETNEDAQNALNTLNKKNINGREINVELATPREEGAPRPQRPRRGTGQRGGRGGYPPREGGNVREGDSPNSGDRSRGGYVRGRGRRNTPSSPAEANSPNSPNNNGDNNGEQGPRTPNRGRGGYRRGGGNPRGPRSPQNVNRIQSNTTLFVANLPYSLTDEELTNLLPKATKAYVAKNYNNRSKGFGFIEFANEEDQKAALNASEKLQVQGRDLIVKIALTEEKRAGNAAQTETQPAVQAQ
jgi:RNA recognition motif-containing protein